MGTQSTLALALFVFLTHAVESPTEADATAQLQGRVLSLFGDPLEGATVRLTAEELSIDRNAATDATGRYKFETLPPGSYSLTVNLKGFARARREQRLAAGQDLWIDVGLALFRLVDTPSEVHGTVLDPHGASVGGARVVATAALNDRLQFRGMTDAAGRFSVQVHDPGQYLLSVYKEGYRVAAKAVVVWGTPPRQRTGVDFSLRRFEHK